MLYLDEYGTSIMQTTIGGDTVKIEGLSVAVLIGLLGLCSVPAWAANVPPDKSHPKKDYPVLGLVVGTPSLGIDAIVGYDFGPVEMRLSGGVGNANSTTKVLPWGLQANVGLKSIDTKHFVLQGEIFGIYINHLPSGPPEALGAGIGGSLWLYGFFVDFGLGWNFLPTTIQEFDHISGQLQIGYMYRFR